MLILKFSVRWLHAFFTNLNNIFFCNQLCRKNEFATSTLCQPNKYLMSNSRKLVSFVCLPSGKSSSRSSQCIEIEYRLYVFLSFRLTLRLISPSCREQLNVRISRIIESYYLRIPKCYF